MSLTGKALRSYEEFKELIATRKYTIVGNYTYCNKPIALICAAGHQLSMTPNNFKRGPGCARCSKTCKTKYYESLFIEVVRKLGGTVIGEYINSVTSVECICPFSHPCYPIPAGIMGGGGMCKLCRSYIKEEQFHKKAKENGITVLGEYTDNATPILCKCSLGHACYPRPELVLSRGNGFCATCSNVDGVLAKERFLAWAEKNKFELLAEYKNNHEGISAICPKGHRCLVRGRYLTQDRPMCKRCHSHSTGEDKAHEALEILDIKFNREYRLDAEKKYRFDFQLPEYKIMIECDGMQHFQSSGTYAPTQQDVIMGHLKDITKMLLAKQEGYTVIRIDYTWYKRPVEDFVNFIEELIERPRQSRDDFTYSTPEMYQWVDEIRSTLK